jgi:hypothetical protein
MRKLASWRFWLFVAFLRAGGEIGENVLKLRLTQGGPVFSAAGNEGTVDVELSHHPRGEVIMQVAGGVGEGGKDDDLADGFAVLVRVWIAEAVLKDGLEALEFGVPWGEDGFGAV